MELIYLFFYYVRGFKDLLCEVSCVFASARSPHFVPPDITFTIASVVLRRVYPIHCFAPCVNFLNYETCLLEALMLPLNVADINVSPYFCSKNNLDVIIRCWIVINCLTQNGSYIYHLLQQSGTRLFVYNLRVGFIYFLDVNMPKILPLTELHFWRDILKISIYLADLHNEKWHYKIISRSL